MNNVIDFLFFPLEIQQYKKTCRKIKHNPEKLKIFESNVAQVPLNADGYMTKSKVL